jgi:hypothetical protein
MPFATTGFVHVGTGVGFGAAAEGAALDGDATTADDAVVGPLEGFALATEDGAGLADAWHAATRSATTTTAALRRARDDGRAGR